MNFQEFRRQFLPYGCFTTQQAYAWRNTFDKNNLGRWTKQGLLERLRNGYYAFPELHDDPDSLFYIANSLYRPSYVSLHTALAFYGLIPESVIQVTSVTTLKTAGFRNSFGEFGYHSIQPSMMFGYETRGVSGNRSIRLAVPAKAVIDLLYLYPFYNTLDEMDELRIDTSGGLLQAAELRSICAKTSSVALSRRVELFIKSYGL